MDDAPVRPWRWRFADAVRPGLELLRDPREDAAALTPLRGADADALAAADLIDLVEQVQHVGADRHALQYAGAAEVLREAGIEHEVGRQLAAVGDDPGGIV